jgi:hypothetical protein
MTQLKTHDAALTQAEAHLRTACITLIATSPSVVDAMTLSIPAAEFGVSSDDWRDLALTAANAHALDVDVSTRHDHVTIRFTRRDGREEEVS